MVVLKDISITATSMVDKNDQQYIAIGYHCSRACHLLLSVFRDGNVIYENIPIAMDSGIRTVGVLLPVQDEAFDALWQFSDRAGNVLSQVIRFWKKPREWTLYVMISSHTDIGLHESPYIQREECCKIIDEVVKLCDETDEDQEIDRYRYTMEGSWFWNNYSQKHGAAAAQKIADEYIRTGKIGICAGLAGNHFQTFGLEEMCLALTNGRGSMKIGTLTVKLLP